MDKCDKVGSFVSAVREGRLEKVKEVVNSLDCSIIKNWSDKYDLLHRALQENHKEVAKLLLLNGAKVNDHCKFIVTSLHYAASYGHVDIAEMLLNRNAEIEATDVRGRTSLHYAIERNQIGIVKLLLNRGACVDARDRDGKTPLHVACEENHSEIAKIILNYVDSFGVSSNDIKDWRLLNAAIKYGFWKIVSDLLHYGADRNLRFMTMEHTLLHTATIYQQEKVIEQLIKCGANVNAKDGDMETPIFYAINHCHLNIIKLLLANGANITSNIDLLNAAVSKGSIEVVEILLQCYSSNDVNGGGKLERRAFNSAVPGATHPHEFNEEVLKRLKITNETRKLHTSTGSKYLVEMEMIPLHIAIERGHKTIATMLLNKGANVNAKIENGTTALHIATHTRHKKLVEILLKYGAEVDPLAGGMTPLHIAAVKNSLSIVKTLIQFGASVDSVDEHGRTALHIACHFGFRDMILVLLLNGSDINISNDVIVRRLRDTVRLSECSNVIARHIAKLKACNLFVNETYLQAIRSNPSLEDYYFSCEREIREMKKVKICNTNVSFNDILTKRVHQLAIYARNENIVEVFKSIHASEYADMFPIYLQLLENQFRKGQQRLCLLTSSVKCINSLSGYEFPNLFTDEVYSYLSNSDLVNLINACSYDI